MTTLSIQQPLPLFYLREVDYRYVINSNAGSYNPEIWEKTVLRYLKFENVKFYQKKGEESFFVIYTIPEGLRLIAEITFYSSLSNSPFIEVYLDEENGLCTQKFAEVYVLNTPKNRKILAEASQKFGRIFSNDLPLSKTKKVEFQIP